MKKKIGTLLRDILGSLVDPHKRDELASRLDDLEDTIDRVGDLVRGRDDAPDLSARVDAIEARLDRLEKPKRAARRLAAEEG